MGVARAWQEYFGGDYSTGPAFLAFLGGIIMQLSVWLLTGWLVDRRGTLLSAGINHGLVDKK